MKKNMRLLPAAPGAWQCPNCGAWNHAQARECCVCKTKKPK